MNIIFLDFDGPVIPARMWLVESRNNSADRATFDPAAVAMVKKLLCEAKAKLVISSTWSLLGYPSIVNILERHGFNTDDLHKDWTSWANNNLPRWLQIKMWVENHLEVEKWIAIDDAPIAERLGTHAIEVSFDNGMLMEDYQKARQYFNLPYGKEILL